MSQISVVFLSPHSDPEADLGEQDAGGQCVYENQLAQALSRMPDVAVTTYCRQTNRRPDVSVVNDRYRIKRISCGPKGFVRKEALEEHLFEFSQNVAKELSGSSQVVLHGHYWDGGKASLQVKHLGEDQWPMIWTPHSLGYIKQKKLLGWDEEIYFNFIPRQAWETYTMTVADRILVSTDKEKDVTVNNYGILPEKVEVIPPGVALEEFRRKSQPESRRKFDLPQEKKMLLCLGRMSRNKGYQHAIKSLKLLVEKFEEVFLVICGGSLNPTDVEETKYMKYLRDLTKELELEDYVIFKSAISFEDVPWMYSAADLLLLTSEYEPFGLTMLEAMATSLPVIAGNKGGPANVITHNVTGTLVDIHDYVRLSRYILSYLKDEDQYTKIARNSRKYVEETYSWDTQAQKFLDVYLEELQKGRRQSFKEWVESCYFLKKGLN